MSEYGISLSYSQRYGKKRATIAHGVGENVMVTAIDDIKSINEVGSGMVCIMDHSGAANFFPKAFIYSMEVK